MPEVAGDPGEISDGYHTFNELYEHRFALFIALCAESNAWARAVERKSPVWRSRVHADGTMFDGWFVMGINPSPGRQITYHLPIRLWPATNFALTLERAPEWDGHTSEDVIKRLLKKW